jgi:hypothetical protein
LRIRVAARDLAFWLFRAYLPNGAGVSPVKPSAQPTLVRTQHLPPPAKTAPGLRRSRPVGRLLVVPPWHYVPSQGVPSQWLRTYSGRERRRASGSRHRRIWAPFRPGAAVRGTRAPHPWPSCGSGGAVLPGRTVRGWQFLPLWSRVARLASPEVAAGPAGPVLDGMPLRSRRRAP